MTMRMEDKAAACGLTLWGSDCTVCGNATADSMECDLCGSTLHTVALWDAREPLRVVPT